MSSAEPDRLSVIHVVAPAPFGGLEGVLRALAVGHAKRGHEVHVIAVLDQEDSAYRLLEDLRGGGVNVLPLTLPSRAYLRERAYVRDVYKRVRPDIVHTHGYRPDVLHAGPLRRLRTATVTTIHGYTFGDWTLRLYQRLHAATLHRLDGVVAVSRPIFDKMRRWVARDRLYLLPNAWHGTVNHLDRHVARRELGIPDGAFHLGWVGRLSREKGADTLIEALPHLGELPCFVSLLGDGPERHSIEQQLDRLGLQNRVTLHGTVPEAARYFRSFDVFVLSSRSEGTPLALLEAMDAGVPVIATEVGGVPDAVTREEALLVPPENPSALSQAIQSAFRDSEGSAARARAARERLKTRFAPEPWLDRYEDIYRQVVRHASRRRP